MPATGPEPPIVAAHGLECGYDGEAVLSGIDLEVRPGEVFVIMGRSGSGKSTLLRALIGLDPPLAGSVKLLGSALAELSRDAMYTLRREVGVAFQSGALFSSMSVGENVALPLRRTSGLDANTITIMTRLKLELMDLADAADRMPSQLSGGMRKRVGLARAVVMDPRLVFFDEPSSGLDPETAADLDELILKLKSALGITLVVVTHDLTSAFKLADRMALVGDGGLIATGTPAAIRASTHPSVQAMLERRARHVEVDGESYLDRLTDAID